MPVFGPFPLTGNYCYVAAGSVGFSSYIRTLSCKIVSYFDWLHHRWLHSQDPRKLDLADRQVFWEWDCFSKIASSDRLHRAAKQNCAVRFPKEDNGTSFLHRRLLCSWIQNDPKPWGNDTVSEAIQWEQDQALGNRVAQVMFSYLLLC